LDEKAYLELMSFSRKVAQALEKTVPCKRIGMTVIGLEVPHVHVHLIPLQEMSDATFANKVTLAAKEFAKLADKIAAKF